MAKWLRLFKPLASPSCRKCAERNEDAHATENGRGTAATADSSTGAAKATARTKAATSPAPETKPTAPAPTEPVEAIPIRGAALKIVENMEASLSVPTATSQRRIPVKLLDENRRLINKHLQENDRGKASYTHLIAWALLRALDEFPQLNDGYDDVVTAVRCECGAQTSIWASPST